VIELKRFWARIREPADIPDVCIHNLRHTSALLLISERVANDDRQAAW
jgi:integrase